MHWFVSFASKRSSPWHSKVSQVFFQWSEPQPCIGMER